MDKTLVLMETLRLRSFGALGYVTACLEAENRQKVANLNRYISVSTNIDEKRFMDFQHNYYQHLSSGYARLPQVGYCFFLAVSQPISF